MCPSRFRRAHEILAARPKFAKAISTSAAADNIIRVPCGARVRSPYAALEFRQPIVAVQTSLRQRETFTSAPRKVPVSVLYEEVGKACQPF